MTSAHQRCTLCASSALNGSPLTQIETKLRIRIAGTLGTSAVRVTHASSRCVTIRLTAQASRKSAVVGAGQVGNFVLADDGNDPTALQPGDLVRLVCPRPACSPGPPVGKARLNAHPPILSVVMPAGDVRTGSAQVGRDSGGSPNVGFYFTQQGSNRWCSFTAAHVNRYSAAVVDGVVAEAFVIGEALCAGTFVIVQPLSTERAYQLVGYLKTGPLPIGLRLRS